jgi:preprotein translocase subunit SecG
MQTVLIVFHLMIVVALVGSVLLQRSEGGALGVGGGGGFMTGRGQANALTRATAILAALFFATSLALSIMASYSRAPKSILDTAAPHAQTTAPVPGGNPLDQLKKLEEERNAKTPAAPAAPPVPAEPEAPKSQ